MSTAYIWICRNRLGRHHCQCAAEVTVRSTCYVALDEQPLFRDDYKSIYTSMYYLISVAATYLLPIDISLYEDK